VGLVPVSGPIRRKDPGAAEEAARQLQQRRDEATSASREARGRARSRGLPDFSGTATLGIPGGGGLTLQPLGLLGGHPGLRRTLGGNV
jgi:hypothetical protein